MQHDSRSVHTYYGSSDDCMRLVAWLMTKNYWFEGDSGLDGYTIRCAVAPTELVPALDIKIETLN